MTEQQFQKEVIDDIKFLFPGCIVLKNDPSYIQGMPDLTVLWNNSWALLECKISEKAKHQPNQDYYIERAQEMGFGSFIFPENKVEVLYAMERSFKGRT